MSQLSVVQDVAAVGIVDATTTKQEFIDTIHFNWGDINVADTIPRKLHPKRCHEPLKWPVEIVAGIAAFSNMYTRSGYGRIAGLIKSVVKERGGKQVTVNDIETLKRKHLVDGDGSRRRNLVLPASASRGKARWSFEKTWGRDGAEDEDEASPKDMARDDSSPEAGPSQPRPGREHHAGETTSKAKGKRTRDDEGDLFPDHTSSGGVGPPAPKRVKIRQPPSAGNTSRPRDRRRSPQVPRYEHPVGQHLDASSSSSEPFPARFHSPGGPPQGPPFPYKPIFPGHDPLFPPPSPPGLRSGPSFPAHPHGYPHHDSRFPPPGPGYPPYGAPFPPPAAPYRPYGAPFPPPGAPYPPYHPAFPPSSGSGLAYGAPSPSQQGPLPAPNLPYRAPNLAIPTTSTRSLENEYPLPSYLPHELSRPLTEMLANHAEHALEARQTLRQAFRTQFEADMARFAAMDASDELVCLEARYRVARMDAMNTWRDGLVWKRARGKPLTGLKGPLSDRSR